MIGIPILSDVLDGMKFLINFFFDKVPKPIKIFIFLFFLVIFGTVISFSLHLFGIHCNTDGDAVKTNVFSFGTNIKIAFLDNEVYNISSFAPPSITTLFVGENCFAEVCHDYDDYWWYSDFPNCSGKPTVFPFLTKNSDWSKCVTCSGDENYTVIHRLGLGADRGYYCYGDAYRIDDEDLNWFQKQVCDPESRCMPPANYYYEYDTGTFDCLDPSVCGENATNRTLVSELDETLKNANAELLYSDSVSDYSYKKFAGIKCDNKSRPNLTFYGINIFDYRFWLLIVVLYVLVMVLLKFRDHH